MRLSPGVASEIQTRAKTVLNREVLVADARGVVLVGDPVGSIVVDALRACQEGRVIRAELGESLVSWCPFVYENKTIGAFGVIDDGLQVTPEAIGLLQGLSEVIAHQQFLAEHVRPSDAMRASFLRQVLASTTMDTSEAYRQADILQLNLRQPQAVMLVEIDGLERDIIGDKIMSLEERERLITEECGRIRELLLKAFTRPGNIVSYAGNDQFVVCKSMEGEGLTTRNTTRFLRETSEALFRSLQKSLTKRTVSLGVGQYYPDLGGLRKSFQEAKLSLLVGAKVWGTGRVYHIKQVGMFVTLANVAQERKAELAHQILHPLLRDEQLYKTVQTFLQAGLNLTDAAEKLHVHRNTLIYRLDKTKKVIGLDPRVFDDALQIKLGLMFYQEEAVA